MKVMLELIVFLKKTELFSSIHTVYEKFFKAKT